HHYTFSLLLTLHYPIIIPFPYTTLFRSFYNIITMSEDKNKLKPTVLWFTGLSGSGKSTISEKVYPALKERGYRVEHLDGDAIRRSEEHTSELQSRFDLVCRLLLEKKNNN